MTKTLQKRADGRAVAETLDSLRSAESALAKAATTGVLTAPTAAKLARTVERLRDIRQHVETHLVVRGDR